MSDLHIIELPVCGGRVWCHTRLTHREDAILADALLATVPDNLSADMIRQVQKLAGDQGHPSVIDLPPGLMEMGRNAQTRQREYDETLVRTIVDHWSDLRTRDGAEIAAGALDDLDLLDAEDWEALVKGAKEAQATGRPDPQRGRGQSSVSSLPVSPSRQKRRANSGTR